MSIINERDITVKKQSVNADVFEKLDKAVESATFGSHLGDKGYGFIGANWLKELKI